MDYMKEYFQYIQLALVLVSSILAVVLSVSLKNLIGKRWLVSASVLTLISWPSHIITSILVNSGFIEYENIKHWWNAMNLIGYFNTACFGLFLFSIWANKRINISIKDILFSFNGRISRASFWIVDLIIFPLGTFIGLTAGLTEAEGLPKIFIWIIYICWSLISIWISLSVFTKRWHDCGKSGWMTLIGFIPIIGALWLIIYLGFIKGTNGLNKYGEDTILNNIQGNTIIIENA